MVRRAFSPLLVLFALCALIVLPTAAQEEPAWQFTKVNGNRIAWSCSGQGQPTVVLIAGLGLTSHDSFGRIYHNYDGPGRVCMYDRAGIGKSDFANPQARTLDQLVDELHGVSSANAWGSAVLAPHSFGGFISRAYANKHPREVRGILFLDVAHEDYVPRMKAKMSDGDWAIMENLLAWNVRTFHEDYLQAQEAIRSTKIPPGLPITVLSRGIPHTVIRAARVSYEGLDVYESEHQLLQEEIAKLSNNSEHRIARYSSHVFNDSDPWIVIDEIKLLIKRLPN